MKIVFSSNLHVKNILSSDHVRLNFSTKTNLSRIVVSITILYFLIELSAYSHLGVRNSTCVDDHSNLIVGFCKTW